jgi:hypothetical protein
MLVLQTGLGNRLTFHEIYSVLLEQNCLDCGQFGGFMYLPTASRACISCLFDSEVRSTPRVSGGDGLRWNSFCTVDVHSFLDNVGVSLPKVQKALPVVRTRRDVYPHRDGNVSWSRFETRTDFEYQIGAYVCNLTDALDQIMWKYLYIESEDSDDSDDDGVNPGPAVSGQTDLWGENATSSSCYGISTTTCF